MEIIAHRRNTCEELAQTPPQYGIEVDIRSRGKDLIIHHDPFVEGVLFEDWIRHYRHGTLILNVKEEGLEQRLIALMAEHKIEHFFFLDQSFPFLIKTARTGERRCAVRVSEFESIETAMQLAGMVDWIWVDCFTRLPLTGVDAQRLQRAGFKLCLVSPELQGRDPHEGIPAMAAALKEASIRMDAVCTKQPALWERCQ